MKTHFLTILVDLQNTIIPKCRGPLSNSLVRILIKQTVFLQLFTKLRIGNFEKIFYNQETSIFESFLM